MVYQREMPVHEVPAGSGYSTRLVLRRSKPPLLLSELMVLIMLIGEVRIVAEFAGMVTSTMLARHAWCE